MIFNIDLSLIKVQASSPREASLPLSILSILSEGVYKEGKDKEGEGEPMKFDEITIPIGAHFNAPQKESPPTFSPSSIKLDEIQFYRGRARNISTFSIDREGEGDASFFTLTFL